MRAMRIPIFVLAALLAFSVWNAVHLTRRCACGSRSWPRRTARP